MGQSSHTQEFAFHNHPFHSCVAVALSNAAAYVPEALDKVARLMAKSNQPCVTIRDTLTAGWKAENKGTPVPWGDGNPGYKFLYHRYCQAGGSLDVDFEGLLEKLKERKENRDLPFWLDHNPATLRVNRMYVALAGGAEEWEVGGEDNVLLFDPTWGTNLYRWKLCMIATVASTGETVILAYALVEDESTLSFEWIFSCLSCHLPTPPRVVFSDHDDKIETALLRMKESGVWPKHLHFLCVYHLSKNIFQHLRCLFLSEGGGKLWTVVHNRFWQITKNTDSRSRDTFEMEWEGLVQTVRETATNSDKLDAELRWLEKLGEIAPRFAYRFTWETCTLGMHSTQRIESMQRVSKETMKLNTRSRLLELQGAMEDYNESKRSAMAVQDVRLSLRQGLVPVSDALQSMQKKLTTYAYNLVLSQASEAVHYRSVVDYWDNEDDIKISSFNVYRTKVIGSQLEYNDLGNVVSWNCPEDFGVNTPEPERGRHVVLFVRGEGVSACLIDAQCTCQFGQSWGMYLCRHVQHCMALEQVQCVEAGECAIPKWDKSFDVAALIEESNRRSTSGVSGSTVVRDSPSSARCTSAQSAATTRSSATPMHHELWGSAAKRKAHLLEVHSTVLQLGCNSDALCGHVSDALFALRTSAKELAESDADATAWRAAAAAAASPSVGEGQVHEPSASNQPHFDWLPVATKSAISTAMGLRYVLGASSPLGGASDDGGLHAVLGQGGSHREHLVGCHIVCNWPKRNDEGEVLDEGQSGWLIGKVVGCTEEVFSVAYGEVDGEADTQDQNLTEKSCLNFCVSTARHRTKDFDWYLLTPRGLHNVPLGGTFGRPAAQSRGKRGRPDAEKRKSPVAGPTSKRTAAAAAGHKAAAATTHKRKGSAAKAASSPSRCSPRSRGSPHA